MHKLYLSMALLMSLVLGSGFAISGNSVSAQSYGYNDDKSYDDSYSSDKSYDDSYSSDKSYDDSYSSDSYSNYPSKDSRHDDKERFNFDFYVVTGEPYTETFNGAATLPSTATCEAGDQVTGGGFELTSTPETGTTVPIADADVTISKPFENVGGTSGEGWKATAVTTEGSGSFTLTAYAVCFDNPPPHDNNNQP